MWNISPIEAMRNRIPDHDDDYLDMILWSCTAFPFNRPYKALRQAVYFEEMAKQKISVCSRCGKPYLHNSGKAWIDELCEVCRKELRGIFR